MKRWQMLVGLLVIILISNVVFNSDLTIKKYYIQSEKVEETFRIALITDLHSGEYGEGQEELLSVLSENKPDIVLFGGDIADSERPLDNMIKLTLAASEKYPCYYVLGNHEYRRRDLEIIKKTLSVQGIRLLRGQNVELTIKGQKVYLSGIDDLDFGMHFFEEQLESSAKNLDHDYICILLTHRPEQIAHYLVYDFDLILAGHTHGGQWRIPYILNGLWAPDQGFFPKYGGGEYQFENSKLIISRGLAHEYTRIPRIFNPPEIVLIDIQPIS